MKSRNLLLLITKLFILVIFLRLLSNFRREVPSLWNLKELQGAKQAPFILGQEIIIFL
jgi:hypothetical protein